MLKEKPLFRTEEEEAFHKVKKFHVRRVFFVFVWKKVEFIRILFIAVQVLERFRLFRPKRINNLKI